MQTVTYQEPTIQRLALGTKPANFFNDSPELTPDTVQLTHGSTVWGDVPLKNPDGTAQLRTVTEELDLTPRSPVKYGLVAGGVGAGVGALAGFLLTSQALGAVAGGALLGGVAGAVAAFAVKGDQVKVVWDTHEIKDHQMVGFQEHVGLGEKGGQRGYFHRFVPDVQETVIGSYQTPRTEHHKP